MHDPRTLLDPSTRAAERLARRGYQLDLPSVEVLVARRAKATAERDGLRAAAKTATRKATPSDADASAAAGRELREQIQNAEAEVRRCEARLNDLLLSIPNLPDDVVPSGGPADPMVEVRQWGRRPEFSFAPRDHVALGTRTGILDPDRAGKLAGSRFSVAAGAGARLERALVSFFLDLHTSEHGYQEISVPHLVTRETMTATGQLPKFESDLFSTRVGDRELFLIPTAEVPLVNLYRGETLPVRDLPIAVTAHTACFRSEAGSYGRDTRGIIRLHQFAKVELVRICTAADAARELELMVAHAEECLRRLDLHHRVVELRAGDLGFSARRTFDIEVWLPSQDCYREISSVSDCGTFQGRRAGIKVRDGATKEVASTLNGSGLPIGRTLVALLEQGQREDGSIVLPAALVPYTGFEVIAADGTVK